MCIPDLMMLHDVVCVCVRVFVCLRCVCVCVCVCVCIIRTLPSYSIVGTGSIIFISLISGQMTNSDVRLLLTIRHTTHMQLYHPQSHPTPPLPSFSHPLPLFPHLSHQVHPIFMLSVADFLVAVLWLISSVIVMVNPGYIELCYFSGLLTTVRTSKHTTPDLGYI